MFINRGERCDVGNPHVLVVPAGRMGPYNGHSVNDARENRVSRPIVKRRWVSSNGAVGTEARRAGRSPLGDFTQVMVTLPTTSSNRRR